MGPLAAVATEPAMMGLFVAPGAGSHVTGCAGGAGPPPCLKTYNAKRIQDVAYKRSHRGSGTFIHSKNKVTAFVRHLVFAYFQAIRCLILKNAGPPGAGFVFDCLGLTSVHSNFSDVLFILDVASGDLACWATMAGCGVAGRHGWFCGCG